MKAWKKIAALLLSACLLLGLTGCGLFSTKMARAMQKMSKVGSLHIDVQVDLQLELGAGAKTAPVNGRLSGGVDLFPDPLLARADLQLDLPGFERQLLYYFEKENDVLNIYSNTNGGSVWEKRASVLNGPAVKVNGLRYFVDGTSDFELVGPETVDGVEAVRYDGTISGEYLKGLVELYDLPNRLAEGYGLELPDGLLDDLRDVDASLWLSAEDGTIARVELDATELAEMLADSLLADMRRESGMNRVGVELRLKSLTGKAVLSDFDKVEKFQIPDEAVAAWGEEKQPWD